MTTPSHVHSPGLMRSNVERALAKSFLFFNSLRLAFFDQFQGLCTRIMLRLSPCCCAHVRAASPLLPRKNLILPLVVLVVPHGGDTGEMLCADTHQVLHGVLAPFLRHRTRQRPVHCKTRQNTIVRTGNKGACQRPGRDASLLIYTM